MAENQIAKVSVKHDAIMDYLIVNPAARLGDVALHFRVSQPWLSVIIHSDAFQIVLKKKQSSVLNATVVPLREKVLGIAHLGIEKLGDALENASAVTDKEFIADTTDSILKNLGFSPKSAPSLPAGNVTNNNIMVVDKEALASARDKMRTVPVVSEVVETVEVLTVEALTIEQESGSTTEKV